MTWDLKGIEVINIVYVHDVSCVKSKPRYVANRFATGDCGLTTNKTDSVP